MNKENGRNSGAWILGRSLRQELRNRLRRERAFGVSANDRRVVRNNHAFLAKEFFELVSPIKIMPINSLEWTSECRTLAGLPIVVFDTEQANAISFLVKLTECEERPIFHQTEFLIRASEILLAFGETESAFLCAKQNYNDLAAYARRLGSYPEFERPFYFDSHMVTSLTAIVGDIIPSYILAHEIGHAIFRQSGNKSGQAQLIFERISEFWSGNGEEVGQNGPNTILQTFERPDTELFFENGKPSRLASKGTDKVDRMVESRARMIEENFADFFAFCAISERARLLNLSPKKLFVTLIHLLESAERLLILRRSIARMPRGVNFGSVRFEASNLGFRIFGLLCLLRDSWKSPRYIPSSVCEYWKTCDPDFVDFICSADSEQELVFSACSSDIIARAGLHVGAGGELPDPKKRTERRAWIESLGPLAGTIGYLHAHGEVSACFVDMSLNDNWSPESSARADAIGFSCSLTRIMESLMHPDRAIQRIDNDWFDRICGSESPFENPAMFVRRPRICARMQSFA